MEIISLLVVLSIVACVFFIGMATVRLIQSEDQPSLGRKSRNLSDTPSNDLVYSEASRSNGVTTA